MGLTASKMKVMTSLCKVRYSQNIFLLIVNRHVLEKPTTCILFLNNLFPLDYPQHIFITHQQMHFLLNLEKFKFT